MRFEFAPKAATLNTRLPQKPAGCAKTQYMVARPEPRVAPFTKGQAIDSLKITSGDNPAVAAEAPLYVLEAVSIT